MSSSVNSHALIAAFSFGIVANVASNAIILFSKGYGLSILRHVQRLLLVLFLAAAGLWAFIDFVVMTTQSTPTCQVALGFAAGFDQLARVAFSQFLLWASVHGPRLSLGTCLPQGIIVLRFILGGVFVGLQRPQLQPVCLSYTLLLPLGIAVVAVDGALALAFLAKVNWGGSSGVALGKELDLSRDKKLMLTILAFGAWTAMSSPMIIGVRSFHLALRTVLPAAGLLILIGVVLICRNDLTLETTKGPIFTPDGSPPRPRQVSVAVTEHNSPGGFVAVPPSIPELPSPEEFVNRSATTVTSITAQAQFPKVDKQLPKISQPGPGASTVGVGGLPVTGQLFPPMRTEPRPENAVPKPNGESSNKRKIPRPRGKDKVADLVISGPIFDESSANNPLNKIPTVSLETARKRAQHPQPLRSHSIVMRSEAPAAAAAAAVPREIGREDEVSRTNNVPAVTLEPSRESHWTASTTSAQPSPGIEEMRRRSPRQPIAPALDPIPPPPPPPLKTPRTISTSQQPPSILRTQSVKTDTWDLLSVPRPLVRPSPTSSTASKASSGKDRPATALSLGTMSTSSGPSTKVGQRSRSQSLSSRRSRSREVAHDVIFTDPRTPPPIPKLCTEPGTSDDHKTEDVIRQSPPPPYKASGTKTPRTSMAAPPYNMPPTSATLSLFPAPQSMPIPRPPTRTRVPSVSGTPPRSRDTVRVSIPDEHKRIQEQSIMLLKEIEYSQPIDVNEIVEQYLGKKPPSSPSTVILESVLNRPRPVPRTPEAGHFFQMFKGEPKIQHQAPRRRSLSCSSVKTRKSMMYDIADSPAKVPTLPPMPQHDGEALRPLLRDAKSMTFEEKMTMFFPRSPSAHSGATTRTTRRRSSSLFEMASSEHFSSKVVTSQPANDDEADKRTSRSSATTVRTHSLFNIPEQLALSRQLSRNSTNPQQVMDNARESRVVSQGPARSLMDIKRQSSPVLPAGGLETPSSMSEASSAAGDYDARPETPESTTKTVVPRTAQPTEPSPVSMETASPSEDFSDTANFEIQILNRSNDHVQTVPIKAIMNEGMDKWHRRIGEDCPTFSNRKGLSKPRKLSPPTPLALGTSMRGPILVAAEPSPLESPTQALQLIEDQLKRLERSDQQSAVTEQQRKTLIANLELEMNMQESQWQMMRRDTIRDSLSTVTTVTPSKDNSDNLRMSGLPRMDRHSIRSSLAENRNSGHLLEASYRLEALNRRSMLSNPGSRISFLTVSHPASQLGSPTPPDTDESDHEESMEIPMVLDQILEMPVAAAAPSLWRVGIPSPVIIASYPKLWSPTFERAADPWFDTYLASQKLEVQPAMRKDTKPLEIETSELWRPNPPSKPYAVARGLWKSTSAPAASAPAVAPAPAVKPKPKPAAIARKPSRKSKRITELPDIPESPKPLPDSRGTLGIFKFPWGEISDTAVVPGPTFSAMPGTMTSGRGSALMSSFFGYGQQQGPVMPRRADSYFDEMDDEEDAGDNFSDMDSDDDFDESTLWEIASLLQSTQVPSRESLLPGEWLGGRGNLNRQFLQAESPTSPASPLPPCEEIVPFVLDISVSRPAPVEKPMHTLWEAKSQFYKASASVGLPQPRPDVWASYTTSLVGGSAPKKTQSTDSTMTAAGSLCSKPEVARPSPASESGLWSKQEVPLAAGEALWRPSPITVKPVSMAAVGLAQPSPATWVSYTTPVVDDSMPKKINWTEPAKAVSGSMWSKSERDEPALSLHSSLWSPKQKTSELWRPSPVAANANLGLTQPNPAAWASYITPVLGSLMPKKAVSLEPTATATGSLWSQPERDQPSSTPASGLWSSQQKVSFALWSPSSAPIERVQSPDSLWSFSSQRQSHDSSSSVLSVSHDTDIPRQGRRPEAAPAPQITSSTLWRSSHLAGRTMPRPNWIRIKTSHATDFSTRPSLLQRTPATAADWAAALAEAVAASAKTATSRNELFLWSSLSRQRRVPQHLVDDLPRLWVPGPETQEEGTSTSADAAPLPHVPRHKQTKSTSSSGERLGASLSSDDFIGQGLWCRVEAASRKSRIAKRTDWLVRCGA